MDRARSDDHHELLAVVGVEQEVPGDARHLEERLRRADDHDVLPLPLTDWAVSIDSGLL